jgi:hypothetical protein
MLYYSYPDFVFAQKMQSHGVKEADSTTKWHHN